VTYLAPRGVTVSRSKTPNFDFLRQKSGNFCHAPPGPAVGCLDPPWRLAVAQGDRMDHPGWPGCQSRPFSRSSPGTLRGSP
jgi:hypothetical protein